LSESDQYKIKTDNTVTNILSLF